MENECIQYYKRKEGILMKRLYLLDDESHIIPSQQIVFNNNERLVELRECSFSKVSKGQEDFIKVFNSLIKKFIPNEIRRISISNDLINLSIEIQNDSELLQEFQKICLIHGINFYLPTTISLSGIPIPKNKGKHLIEVENEILEDSCCIYGSVNSDIEDYIMNKSISTLISKITVKMFLGTPLISLSTIGIKNIETGELFEQPIFSNQFDYAKLVTPELIEVIQFFIQQIKLQKLQKTS